MAVPARGIQLLDVLSAYVSGCAGTCGGGGDVWRDVRIECEHLFPLDSDGYVRVGSWRRGVEIPECPVAEHAGSVVVRAGWYGKPPHRRQRWLCRPANGDARHRFTPVLTRQGEPGAFCVECSTGLEPWEGQAGA